MTNVTTATSYAYDVSGNLVTTTLPSGNGHVETRSYDCAGRLASVVNAKGPLTLSKALYTYDAVSNPLSVETLTGTTTHGYDAIDRLTEACFPPGCPGGVGPDVLRYTYEAVGNRVSEVRRTATTTYTYDAADQIQSSVTGAATKTYSHDANGNLTGDGPRTFAYDLAGRMKSATVGPETTTYAYDGVGKRLRATAAATTKFLWDPNHALPMLARESDGADALVRRYVYGNGVVSMATGGSDFFFHRDGLGSITDVTSASGTPQWSYAYEPFGATRSATKLDLLNAPDNPVRFTGEYLDPTGLYHLRARQMDPSLGRFTARDPWPTHLYDAAISPYVYADDRPTVLIDPSGLFTVSICVGANIGFFVGVVFQSCVGTDFRSIDVSSSVGGGFQTPAAGANIQAQVTSASCYGQVAGPFDYDRFTAGPVAVDSIRSDSGVWGGEVGAGPAIPPFEYHSGSGDTQAGPGGCSGLGSNSK